MVEEVSSLKSCLICTAPVNVSHYGVDACRACASFFKRTKLAGKSFVCRQGNNKCLILKDERFTCCRCRYERCVAVGMAYDIKHRENENSGIDTAQRSPTDSEEMGPSTSRESKEESILQRIGRQFNKTSRLLSSVGRQPRTPARKRVYYVPPLGRAFGG
ncbi:hypothetical protein PFISCL1PPCAC_3370 [Pristionchus fissidentatus]|uniref:Nuclear receptor domain-containing protein n=1 Tax=Pristionchus fissidentatus TaxID=1538716 RepID=A0AAV5V0X2_9BILA|nr:hypothetical protein PFISCL1PPCAC_3370 [Pristionchus fissidentatus]